MASFSSVVDICTHCGTKHQPAAKFCTGCGTPVPAASAPASAPVAPPLPESESPVAAVHAPTPLVGVTDFSAVAQEQSTAAQRAAQSSTPVVAAPAVHEATLPGMTMIGAQSVAPPVAAVPPAPAAAPAPVVDVPSAPAPEPPPAQPLASATNPPPIPPYATPAAPLPPMPEVHPSVAAASPVNRTPDIAGFARGLKLPGTAEGAEIDAALVKKVVAIGGAVVTGIAMLTMIIRFLSDPSVGGFFGIFFTGLFITLLFVGFIAYKAHEKESQEARTLRSLPPSVQHVVAQMEPGAQAAFFNEYERYKKRIVVAYLLLWLCGAHYFYLRQPLLNAAYWFTGAGAWLWYWIDVFRMPSLVRTANEQSARQALQTLHVGAVFAQMPAAPTHMVQPVPPAATIHPTPGSGPQDR